MMAAMKKTARILLIAALVTALAVGAAYARGGRGNWGGWGGCGQWGDDCGSYYGRGGYGPHYGRGGGYGPYGADVPDDVRLKWAEAQKIEIDLRMELEKNPINREKVLELHAKRRALMNDISDWRFRQRMDALPQ